MSSGRVSNQLSQKGEMSAHDHREMVKNSYREQIQLNGGRRLEVGTQPAMNGGGSASMFLAASSKGSTAPINCQLQPRSSAGTATIQNGTSTMTNTDKLCVSHTAAESYGQCTSNSQNMAKILNEKSSSGNLGMPV